MTFSAIFAVKYYPYLLGIVTISTIISNDRARPQKQGKKGE
jgi:hypothetical protein